MAAMQQAGNSGKGNLVAGSVGTGGAGKARVRKQYDHTMSDTEKYGLQTVQRAQSALKVINDAIKSGKKINPDVIKLCHQINQAAGDMLFAS